MGTRYKQEGKVLEHANSSGSDIAADDIVVIGDVVGIALVDIPDGESGSVAVEGVYEVPKASGTAWSQGDKLDWDASASAFDIGVTPASGDVEDAGVAAVAAAASDTVGEIKLTPGVGTGA